VCCIAAIAYGLGYGFVLATPISPTLPAVSEGFQYGAYTAVAAVTLVTEGGKRGR